MRLKISKFTIGFVYFSLFLMMMTMLIAIEGCGGPQSYNVPDFYAPVFSRITPEVFQTTSAVGLVYSARIKVNDNSGSPKVSLYAKKYGAASFAKIEMAPLEGSIFYAHLPAGYISFDYYFSATDGINAVTYPVGAPAVTYSHLVGVPVVDGNKYYGTEPPVVARPLSNLAFSVDITSDTTLETGFPKLYLQEAGGANRATYIMSATGEVIAGVQKYTTVIAGADFASDKKYEYQIEVKNTASAVHESYTVYYPQAQVFNKFEINSSVNLPPIAILKYDTGKKYFVTNDMSGASDVDLDASASYDPEDAKTGLAYKWAQTSGPKVNFKDSGSHYYFTPSAVGIYTFSLQVQDKNGNFSNTAYTTPAIEVTNTIIPSETFPAEVTAEVVLPKSASPITVVGTITVKNGGRLKIERGVELKFEQDTGFIVENGGIINADGDSSNRITFKSTRAGSIKGQWNGIAIINDNTYPASSFNYCDVISAKTALYVKNSKNPTVSMCNISGNYDGIYSDNSTVTINQNIITDNGTDGVVCVNGSISTISSNTITKNKRYGLRCDNSKSEITQNTLSENNYGMLIANSYKANTMIVNVYNNILKQNTDGMRIENADPVILSNQIENNNDNGILCKNAMPLIKANVIVSNHDTAIQMVDCNYRKNAGALVNNSTISLYSSENEISNNVIAFSGADGIELEGSNPIINHNIIAHNLNSGIYIKSYKDSAGADIVKDEASGLLIINNLFNSNSRASISRNGKPPDHTGAADFANRSIMINNNNFIGMTDYTDVYTGEDLSFTTNEIYFNSPFVDTLPVHFSGANYLVQANRVTLHAPQQNTATIQWNDGRNLRVAPKYSNNLSSAATYTNAKAGSWKLNSVAAAPRGSNGSYNIIVDGYLEDVSLMINSGTSYSLRGIAPNTDIGIIEWVSTLSN